MASIVNDDKNNVDVVIPALVMKKDIVSRHYSSGMHTAERRCVDLDEERRMSEQTLAFNGVSTPTYGPTVAPTIDEHDECVFVTDTERVPPDAVFWYLWCNMKLTRDNHNVLRVHELMYVTNLLHVGHSRITLIDDRDVLKTANGIVYNNVPVDELNALSKRAGINTVLRDRAAPIQHWLDSAIELAHEVDVHSMVCNTNTVKNASVGGKVERVTYEQLNHDELEKVVLLVKAYVRQPTRIVMNIPEGVSLEPTKIDLTQAKREWFRQWKLQNVR